MVSARLMTGLAIAGLLILGLLGPYSPQTDLDVTTFQSQEDFRQYLNQTPSTTAYWSGTARMQEMQQQAASGGSGGSGQPDVSRYSTTNVQEQGIQEPDILKTNGRFFFYAPQQASYPMIATEPETIMPPKYRVRQRNTTILNTLPADNITAQAEIPGTGKLLLMDDTLVRMHGREIEAFDVSQPSAPEQKWSIKLNGSRVAARSYGGTIYIVTQETIEPENPCPITTATGPGGTTTLPCTDIYHPEKPVAVDTTYTVMTIDPATGRIQETTGFVGSRRHSIIYMSKDALYITYLRQKTQLQIVTDFLAAEADQLFDQTTAEKIQK
ncbi:MAG: beta-propeller domain-containing protein, partial [Candidatus Nanohaloarchaea archaeon]|nr:beta-propeller domain-containing protein [Candidatus Nanohaloarchaea archaeon]